jgi:hypothetical protein
MTEGNFVDYVKIFVSSGKGGKGSTHLHREKFIVKGGPDGGDGGMPSAPRTKVSQQTIVLMVVLSVSASAIFGMRTLGVRAGIAMGSDVVEYTPPEIDRNSTYDRILADLARIQNPLDVALGEFGKSPFMLQQTAVAAPVDPVAAGEDNAEQRAAAERQARIEARRKELTDQLAAMKVQSIMGGKAPLARISGEMYRVGDTVADPRVLSSDEVVEHLVRCFIERERASAAIAERHAGILANAARQMYDIARLWKTHHA